MRVLLALGLVVSVSACFAGGGEPLSSTSTPSERAARQAPVSHEQQHPAQLTPRQQAIVDIQVAAQAAHDAAYASAAAGRAHDVFAAQQAAVDLADAATVIHARAVTIASIDGNTGGGGEDCGCGGCNAEPPSDSVSGDPAVDDAVLVSALAAEVGGNVADDLQPPTETQCSEVCGCEGCSQSCQEVAGSIDENQLGSDVDAATDAGDANLDASNNLSPQIG